MVYLFPIERYMTKLTTAQLTHYGLIGVRSAPKPRAKSEYKESSEQGTIARYIKIQHPGLPFITIEREKQRTFSAQNRIKLLNSIGSIPDTFIMQPRGLFAGLWIENKASGTRLTRVKDKRFASQHYADQYETHLTLWKQGYAAYFACSIDEAIDILECYLSGNTKPMQIFQRGFALLKEK